MSLTCLSISELNKEEKSRIEQNVSEWILQFLLLACNGKLGPDTCSSMWYGGALCGSRVRLGKNDLRSWNQKQKIILEAKNHQVNVSSCRLQQCLDCYEDFHHFPKRDAETVL